MLYKILEFCSAVPVPWLEWMTVHEQLLVLSLLFHGKALCLVLYTLFSVYRVRMKWLSGRMLGWVYHSADRFTGISSTVPLVGEMVGLVPALQMANVEVDKAQCKAEVLVFLFCSFVLRTYVFKLLSVTLDLKHQIYSFFLECSCR